LVDRSVLQWAAWRVEQSAESSAAMMDLRWVVCLADRKADLWVETSVECSVDTKVELSVDATAASMVGKSVDLRAARWAANLVQHLVVHSAPQSAACLAADSAGP
jgi:hypothetical protein